MERNKLDTTMVISVIFAGIVSRLVPHPANMALVTAAAIFTGSKLDKTQSILATLSIMLVTDLLLGLHTTIIFTWGAFAIIAILANHFLRKNSTITRVAFITGLSSIIFFIISNFGVWLVGNMYPFTLAGLTASFINAIPFFRNTILGDMIYTAGIFGVYEVIKKVIATRSLVPAKHSLQS